MGSQAVTHDQDRVESTIAAPLYTAAKAAAGTGRYLDRFGPVPW